MKTKLVFSGLFVGSLLLLGACQQTSLMQPSDTRQVGARISSGNVPSTTWQSTDSVHLNAATTANVTLLDTGLSLVGKSGMLTLKTVSVPSDQGVTMTANGFISGTQVWTGTAKASAGSSDTSLEMTASLADTLASGGGASLGTVNAPTLDSVNRTAWATDTFDQPIHIFFSTKTPGAVIHYTLDGSYPNGSSPIYGDTGVLVDSSRTINAIAVKSGWTNSAELTSPAYVLQARPTAIASVSATAWATNTYDQPVTVTLTSATPNAEIHYTLDGSTPTRTSPTYTSAGVVIDSTRTLKVVTYAGKDQPSTSILSQAFILQAQPATIASVSVTAWTTNTYDQPVTVTLTSPTPNAEIHYTLDGSVPTRTSPTYTSAGVVIDSTRTLKVVTYAGKDQPSTSILSQAFILQARPATVASVSVTAWTTNTYDQPVTVTLTSPTPNAEIHYTLDGSLPTRTSPTYTSAGILIDSTRTLKAVTYAGKNSVSATFSQSFVLQVRPVTFVGTQSSTSLDSFSITLSCSSSNAVIHYTRNGTVPSASDSIYPAGGWAMGYDSVTVQAIAVDTLHPNITSSTFTSYRYGPVIPWVKGISYGTLTDSRDGHIYRTVTIGSQTWMAENLNYQPSSSADSSWCYNGSADSCSKYGRLYNWATVMQISQSYLVSSWGGGAVNQGICPSGWHIPTDSEWSILTQYIDSNSSGTNLKSMNGWNLNNGKDIVGFRAVPAGIRYTNGAYDGLWDNANFWSSRESEGAFSWRRYIDKSSAAYKYVANKANGLSLRCKK